MNNQDKIDLFENKPIPKAIATLSLPTVIGCLVMMVYSLADTYFVGILNNPLETAAVTLATPVLLAFNAINNLFGIGTSTLMSRALGLKDYQTVKKASSFGFYCSLASGLIFSLCATIWKSPLLSLLGAQGQSQSTTSAYMFWVVTCGAVPCILNVVLGSLIRAEGSALHGSIGMMGGCLLNIVLDPFFILPFGLNMGAAGAGLATFISNTAACLYFLLYILLKGKNTFVSINPALSLPTKAIVKEIFGVGVPAAIQNLLNVTGLTILNKSCAKYGTEAVSAIGISYKTTLIPMYISLGISQGVMPLIGYNFSSGNRKRMKEAIDFTYKISAVFMVAATLLFFIFAEKIMALFIANELIIEYGKSFIRGMCLAQPFLTIDFLAVAVFQACGMGRRSLLFAFLRKVILEIPAILILDRLFPMYGLAYSQLVAEFSLSIAASVMLYKICHSYKKPAK